MTRAAAERFKHAVNRFDAVGDDRHLLAKTRAPRAVALRAFEADLRLWSHLSFREC
jgi:hypothetical protein